MTRKEAKELSLEMWQFLAEHPEIVDRSCLPDHLFQKIKGMVKYDPLCDIFPVIKFNADMQTHTCPGCPLSSVWDSCFDPMRMYDRWLYAFYEADRHVAAEKIIRVIESWEVEE
jgi:hypothetical protein